MSTVTVHGRRYELRRQNADTIIVTNSRGHSSARVFQTWAWSMHGTMPLMYRSAMLLGAPEAWTIPDRQAVILAAIRLLEEMP